MEFDFAEEQPKSHAVYGLIAFVAVVGGLLLLLDVVPAWFARRRDAQLVAASTGGAPLPRRRRPREGLFALFFLLPTLLLLTIGLVVPGDPDRSCSPSWTPAATTGSGCDNYGWMFSEDSIVRVLRNTLIWVLLVPLLATALGLLYAVLVDKAAVRVDRQVADLPADGDLVRRGRHHLEVRLRLPRRRTQDQIGLLNQIVVWLGGEPQQWLHDSAARTPSS